MTDKPMAQINPKLIKAFIQSTHNVLTTMVGVTPKIGKPTLKSTPSPSYDVSGIVGFSGEVIGSVVISFKEEAALSIIEAFCGDRFEVASDDFVDAIGELSNMIAGNAKKDFNLDASISIPSVIIGPGHSVARLRDVPCIVIPCQSEVGDLAVEVNMKQVTCVKQEEEAGYEISTR